MNKLRRFTHKYTRTHSHCTQICTTLTHRIHILTPTHSHTHTHNFNMHAHAHTCPAHPRTHTACPCVCVLTTCTHGTRTMITHCTPTGCAKREHAHAHKDTRPSTPQHPTQTFSTQQLNTHSMSMPYSCPL